MTKLIDLTGDVYGNLTVLGMAPKTQARVQWVCLCTCGKRTVARGDDLRKGNTRSCGCLFLEELSSRATHGHYSNDKLTPTLISYRAMLQRCNNPNAINYSDYGGRGIKVCRRWSGKRGFEHFLADMGLRPAGMTLDRKENDKGYSPGNCRWATRTEQNGNRRNCKRAAS